MLTRKGTRWFSIYLMHNVSNWFQPHSNCPDCTPASTLLLSPPAGVSTCCVPPFLRRQCLWAQPPPLPPELLSICLISSDLRGGRKWGKARLYSNPLWITAACGYQHWATHTPMADLTDKETHLSQLFADWYDYNCYRAWDWNAHSNR